MALPLIPIALNLLRPLAVRAVQAAAPHIAKAVRPLAKAMKPLKNIIVGGAKEAFQKGRVGKLVNRGKEVIHNYLNKNKGSMVQDAVVGGGVGAAVEYAMDNTDEVIGAIEKLGDKIDALHAAPEDGGPQDVDKGSVDQPDATATPNTPVSELISPDQFTPIFEPLGTAFTASITEALTPLKDAIAALTPCLCKEGGAEGRVEAV